MADMIKVPGVGPVKKPMLIAGVGVIVGVLAFAYYRRSQANAAAAAPADQGNGTSSTDSGYVEDSTASGYNTVYPPGGSQYGPYGYDIYGNPLPPPVSSGSNGVYQTNNDWATAAESALENGNVDLSASTLAISRVLGGLAVTSAQRDLFLQAVGLLGQPPQGYPQPIKLVDTPGQPAPGPSTNIPTARFVKINGTTSWDDLARSYAVFNGNGRALYEYNLLPGKHQPRSYSAVRASWPTIHGKPSWEVDIPVHGRSITLPVVGTVTS